jgi:hypothetical protein
MKPRMAKPDASGFELVAKFKGLAINPDSRSFFLIKKNQKIKAAQ